MFLELLGLNLEAIITLANDIVEWKSYVHVAAPCGSMRVLEYCQLHHTRSTKPDTLRSPLSFGYNL